MDYEAGQYTVRIVAIGGTILGTAPFAITPGGLPPGERFFPEAGYAVKGRFLRYWMAHGLDQGDAGITDRESLALFGYPISGEFELRLEDGRAYTVQYFERARMEFHPEHKGTAYEVLLGQFGRQVRGGIDPPLPAPSNPTTTDRFYSPETGHSVVGEFFHYWHINGGLAQFGYPITEAFEERLEDGNVYRVQYFERARFEHHPKNATPYDIMLGQFGRLILGPTGGPGIP